MNNEKEINAQEKGFGCLTFAWNFIKELIQIILETPYRY